MRVVICDDQAAYRFFLHALLDQDRSVDVVGEGWHGGQAIERCRELTPDVLVMDLDMPVMDGPTAIPVVRAVSPHTQVLVVTGASDSELRARAVDVGAAAVLDKTEEPTTIIARIHELAAAADPSRTALG